MKYPYQVCAGLRPTLHASKKARAEAAPQFSLLGLLFQVFDAVILNASGTQYLYSSDALPGRVYKLTLDGKVLGWMGTSGRQLKQFGWIHEMACASENEVYVGEILNWRVQKLVMKPTAAPQ